MKTLRTSHRNTVRFSTLNKHYSTRGSSKKDKVHSFNTDAFAVL
uniref:Uncharacterized protein n=1 Tax=Anguilla anguilla TaxID=7936 RepID=A0A0E9UXQ0_ANGAN